MATQTQSPARQLDSALVRLDEVGAYLEQVGRIAAMAVENSLGRPDPAAVEALRGALRALSIGATRNGRELHLAVERIKGERPALTDEPLAF